MTEQLRSVNFRTRDRSIDVRVERSYCATEATAAYVELGSTYAWLSTEETAKLHAALTNILAGREVGEPAPAAEEPTPDTFEVGTRVRILPGAFYRLGSDEYPLGDRYDGELGSIVGAPDDDGDYLVRCEHAAKTEVSPECLELAPAPEPELVFIPRAECDYTHRHRPDDGAISAGFCGLDLDPADFTTPVYLPEPEPTYVPVKGDRVRILAATTRSGQRSIPAGSVGVVKLVGETVIYVRPTLDGTYRPGYMLSHGDVEPLTFAVGDRVVKNAEPHRFTSIDGSGLRRAMVAADPGTVGTVAQTYDDGDLFVNWETGSATRIVAPESVDPVPFFETVPGWARELLDLAPVEEPKAPEPLKEGDRVCTVRAGETQTGYAFPKGATAKVVTVGDDLQAGTGTRWATRQAWANVTFDDAKIGGMTVRLADLELAPVEEPLKVGDRVRVTGNDESNPDGKHCYSIGDFVTVDRLGGIGGTTRGSRRSVVVRGGRYSARQGVLVSDLEKVEEPKVEELKVEEPKAPRTFQRGDRVIVTESHEDEDAGDRYLYPAGRIGTVERVGRFDPSRVIVNFDDDDKLADYPFAEKIVAFEPLPMGARPVRGTKLVRITDEGGALDVRPLGSVEEVEEVERDGFIPFPGAMFGGVYSHRFGRVLA